MCVLKKALYIFVLVWVAVLSAWGGVRDDFKANPWLSANNYRAYPDSDLPSLTPPPAGYEPFFINHYGRHGSRWLINGRKYEFPLGQLEKADRVGKLTPRGREVLDILRRVTEASSGRLGELSDIGHEQHQGIARRMFANFPQVFSGDAELEARSTVVIRCILSMQEEVDMLYSLNPQLRVTTDASQAAMYYMNYTDPVARQLHKAARDQVTPYRDKWIGTKHLLKTLFNDQRWARDSVEDPVTFAMDLFEVAGNMQSHHEFERVNLYDLFTTDDLYGIWRYSNAWWYIQSGENPFTRYRVDYMEANLVRNLIEDADKWISQSRHGASLRFGHESVVLPLCCLMGINGADYHTDNLETLDRYWQTYKIFPMAANVQLVYFNKPDSDDVLLLVLLNEHEATLPVPTDVAPFYHWNDVRAYLLDKLSRQPDIPLGIQ